ncbi:MAG TPA: GNAT family N-acetyltransferase [Phycisphaerae bacterium]|nr:GNAT family N-acetyltransferase [Phycisphaerae bacterium]
MPPTVTIARADPSHAQAAAAITREAFEGVAIEHAIERALGPVDGLSWRDIKAEQVLREFRDDPGDCFVALAGGRVVGYVTNDVSGAISRGRISNLAVAGEFRGQGLGRRLIERSLEHFRGLGLTRAKIETLTCNAVGQKLYPSMGFHEVARQVHYVMKL